MLCPTANARFRAYFVIEHLQKITDVDIKKRTRKANIARPYHEEAENLTLALNSALATPAMPDYHIAADVVKAINLWKACWKAGGS